jgi:hypothetical protein
MYSKREATQLRQEFWTAFGQYMAPVLSAEGEKINWTNYKTGEKNIYFRLHADNKTASVAIEIAHKDEALQALYFEQFRELKTLLQNTLQEEWIWLLHTTSDSGRLISRIYKTINPVSVFNKSDWPQLISFFKQRIIALDEFWNTAKHIFEAMR